MTATATADNAAHRYLSALATMLRTLTAGDDPEPGLVAAAALTEHRADNVLHASRSSDSDAELSDLSQSLNPHLNATGPTLSAGLRVAGLLAAQLAEVAALEIRSTKPLGGRCEWFLACTNTATVRVSHPILGAVPTCQRCADRA
jgi:hypothetical protein